MDCGGHKCREADTVMTKTVKVVQRLMQRDSTDAIGRILAWVVGGIGITRGMGRGMSEGSDKARRLIKLKTCGCHMCKEWMFRWVREIQ